VSNLNEDLAKQLYTLTLKDLIKRIQDGTATSADLSVARAICKDANVQMIPTAGNAMGQLVALTEGLPFAGTDGPSH